MRGIATGQRINVLIVPEVNVVIKREIQLDRDRLEPAGGSGMIRAGISFAAEEQDQQAPPEIPGKYEDQSLLEKVVCWLLVSQLESEMKQFR